MWPFDLKGDKKSRATILDQAEYTVFRRVLKQSELRAVLNEKEIAKRKRIKLPRSVRAKIVPDDVFNHQQHPDIRIARRASVISDLARVIVERKVSKGLRNVLYLQAKRLEWLANKRFAEVTIEPLEEGDEPDDI